MPFDPQLCRARLLPVRILEKFTWFPSDFRNFWAHPMQWFSLAGIKKVRKSKKLVF